MAGLAGVPGDGEMAAQIEGLRQFNRFYTRQIGVLGENLLGSAYSLAEARVLYELANRREPTAWEIGRDLGLDAGYLSRILRRFRKDGLLERRRSPADGRQHLLRLTRRGRSEFAKLNRRSRKQLGEVLGHLGSAERSRLVEAARTIQDLLGAEARSDASLILRPLVPGDIGWVIHRHGALYAQEFGWDHSFEPEVAQIAADFVENFDPERERAWIAELDGRIAGSIFLKRKSDTVAKLRLLLVEPWARGHGLGRRLVEECIAFARQAGYRTLELWTMQSLSAARHLYETSGFRCVGAVHRPAYGKDLTAETWQLSL